MDCTQALDDDFTTNLCISDDEKKQVGWLEVGDAKHEVFHGENRIGRDPSLCRIVIDSKTLSKEHAVIEVCGDGTPFIYDLGSLNKTRLGKTVLQPEARYQLLDGSEILFADIKAVYKTISDDLQKEDDSGSETGSESMLNISAGEDAVIPATPAPTRLKPSIIEETIIDSDAEDKPKPAFKSPETASATEVPSCSTGKEQSDEEANDIYEAETQADEFFANDITQVGINDSNKDGLDMTDDIFAAETQCDENYMSTEEQGNERKDESISRASSKSNISNADQEKSICETENQSLDHISPSQNHLKQSGINKSNREGASISTNIAFEDDKSLPTSSEEVTTNSKTPSRGKAVTFSENDNKVGASQNSSKTPANAAVLDDDVDESIYEADTLCMESDFQFLTPKRPLTEKDTIEESDNEEDITEMPTQYLDAKTPSPNHKKVAEIRDTEQDISEMATQQIDLEQPASMKQLKSPEQEDTEQDISEMATLSLDLEPDSTKQRKSSESEDTEQDISEMATLALDLEPDSTKQRKSSESEDAEQDISEMATLALDLEPPSTKQLKSSELEDTEQDISEMATQQLDLEPASSNQHKSTEKVPEQNISDIATQKLDLKVVSTNEDKSAETKENKQDIRGLTTQQLNLESASSNQVKSAEHKSLCGKSESEANINKADKKQENSSSKQIEEILQPPDEDRSSPSLLQEDNEDFSGQRCSDEFNKKDEELKGLNESIRKVKGELQKNNAGDLAVNKEKTAQDNVAAYSGDETDSENIFEAQTQLFCENSATIAASERSRNMHEEGPAKTENEVISEAAETKHTEIVRHPQEDDEDTKSEDLYEAHQQAVISNAESSEKTTTDLQNSHSKKPKESKENDDSAEDDDIYEANTQIIDFDIHSEINANHIKKIEFENNINVTKKIGNNLMQSNHKERENRNITTVDSKNSLKNNANNDANTANDSKECTASVQGSKKTAAQKLPKASNKTEAALTKSKPAKKEKVKPNLEEQDIENIFEAATQVIEDEKPVSPQPCTSKSLNLEEKTALGSKTEDYNESQDCDISELETQPIENEQYSTSRNLMKGKHERCNTDHMSAQEKVLAGSEVEPKLKEDGLSHKASECSKQASQCTESDDSLIDAPTQILNEDSYNMPINKVDVTLNHSDDTSCSKTKVELDSETKTRLKRHTLRKNQSTVANKPTSTSSPEESQKLKNEVPHQVSPVRITPEDEEIAISPTLPSRISKHAPVGKRKGTRNISNEIEKSVKVADATKTRNKKAAEISNQNQSVKDDDDDKFYDSSASSALEISVEVKQSSSKETQVHKKKSNQGKKAKDSTPKSTSVHSKNKIKDTSESPAENTSQNLRPSRQRKMTWKVRESLLSDQETSDSDKSSRKRSATILDNSDIKTSTPIKSRKESSKKTEKTTTDSLSEHSSDVSYSRTSRRRGKLDEQSSSYQKNKIEEDTSLKDLNTSRTSNRTTKRKALDLELPSSSKRPRVEVQKSFTEGENPTEDTNATLLDKKDKNAETKTYARTGRASKNKTEITTEEAVITKRETRKTSITDKSKNKNLKKQSSISEVKELEESESEPDLETQASSFAKSRSQKANVKTSVSKTNKERKSASQNLEKENKVSPATQPKQDLPQTRSRRTAKDVDSDKHSKNSRQKKINVEERPDPGGSSKENDNNTKMVETQEKERSSSRRKRKTSNTGTVLEENEEYTETPSKRSRLNSRKTSGQLMDQSDITLTSTPSTSQSSTPNKRTPRNVNRKGGKNSITTSQKKEDQLHSRSDVVNIDSSDDTTIITPKRASRKGDSQNRSLSETLASTPKRSTPRRTARNQESECHVLFTGISDAKQEAIVKSLGGTVVDLPESCTVLVTDKVRRTFKFLCIMGKGKPIVSPLWLTQSKQAGKFLDPWKYLIKDQESETKFHFCLKSSLERASKTSLLAGYNIFVTPKVLPPPPEMRGIVESCGGTYIPHLPSSSWPEKSFIISCKEDKTQWTKLKKSGKPIVGAEILLLGVLQQKLDIKSNTLV